MGSVFGERLKISIFGQSHAEAIGVVIDGFPPGMTIDFDALSRFMARRAPGQGLHSTQRREADNVRFLSGVKDGVTCGAPICAVIENTDTRSADYAALYDIPRPSHADFAANAKFHGFQDVRGGGHFSGRLTAPLCIAGALCMQYLSTRNIEIRAHAYSIADVTDAPFDPCAPELSEVLNDFPISVLDRSRGEAMLEVIAQARSESDSVGGVIECAVVGVPAGIGDPMFGGVENKIASAVFGVPAVKGIEFGSGFQGSRHRGSLNNDEFIISGESVRTRTNSHGGALGGISSGMPILFRAAIKPTPSIAKEQMSVSLSERISKPLIIHGRHDPCIVPRAVPCIEAAAAIAVCDLLL